MATRKLKKIVAREGEVSERRRKNAKKAERAENFEQDCLTCDDRCHVAVRFRQKLNGTVFGTVFSKYGLTNGRECATLGGITPTEGIIFITKKNSKIR